MAEPACVHDLVAAQTRATPDAVAVDGPTGHWTYRELAGRVNAWAHHLRSLGVGRGDLVAVSLPHSPEVVAVLLGVLTAGAAYLPLDLAYPPARLARTLRDTGASVLVADRGRDTGDAAPRVVPVDEVLGSRASAPRSGVGLDDPMYMIFTSGSTGGPKGVLLAHRSVANHLSWAVGVLGLDRGRGAVLHSSLAFDFAVTLVFAPLLAGRTVLLPRRTGVPGDALTASAESDVDLSFAKVTPSHLRLLTAAGAHRRADRWAGVLLVGGEELRHEDLAAWRDSRVTRVINEYGPTETSVACTAYEVTGAAGAGGVPIGTPIPNVRVHVLDEELRPVPAGETGHLHVGGAAVAIGYWRRPALTAERFVPDLFATDPGARLYATGDLVRELPGGVLEFVGRLDHQVKIRGHRVEPEEVAAELARIPEVAQAAVIVVAGRLAGYVVPRTGATLPDCVAALRDTLPDYLVPATVTVLDSLPLNANGKLDRGRLPVPAVSGGDGDRPPRTPTELVLVELYAQVLDVPEVGVDDDFLRLGGDSVAAVRLQALVAERLATRPRLSTIFTHPRLRDLAAALDREPSGEPDLFGTDIARAPRRPVRLSSEGTH
ncbi:non-ribosomal peptide synthetase [Actinophytocola sediminis]